MNRGIAKASDSANPLAPDIAEHMTINPLVIPDKFEGVIKEAELPDLNKRDQKTVLAMSELGQWMDFLRGIAILQNQQLRELQAETIRRKLDLSKVKDEQTKVGWQRDFLKWLLVTVGAGLIAAALRWLTGK